MTDGTSGASSQLTVFLIRVPFMHFPLPKPKKLVCRCTLAPIWSELHQTSADCTHHGRKGLSTSDARRRETSASVRHIVSAGPADTTEVLSQTLWVAHCCRFWEPTCSLSSQGKTLFWSPNSSTSSWICVTLPQPGHRVGTRWFNWPYTELDFYFALISDFELFNWLWTRRKGKFPSLPKVDFCFKDWFSFADLSWTDLYWVVPPRLDAFY